MRLEMRKSINIEVTVYSYDELLPSIQNKIFNNSNWKREDRQKLLEFWYFYDGRIAEAMIP